jgi:hypothetical protein
MWFYGGSGRVFTYDDNSSPSTEYLKLNTNSGTDTVSFDIRKAGGAALQGSASYAIDAATWYHLVVVVDYDASSPATVTIYVNGDAPTVTYTAQSIVSSLSNIDQGFIGGTASGVNDFTSRIDEVAIYAGTKLTANQVQSHYDAGLGRVLAFGGDAVGWEVSTGAPDTTSAWGDVIQTANGGTAIAVAGGESWLFLIRVVNTYGDTNLMDTVSGTEQWDNGDTSDGIGSDVVGEQFIDANGNTPGTSDGRVDDADIVWTYINESG